MPKPVLHPDLILFGGAFDPPHRGHQQCLAHASETFPQSQIWMMPGARPAGAAGQHKTPTASFEQRFAMCEMLTADMPRVSVSSLEKELPRPNYTARTLERLLEENPDRSLGLIIGQDQLCSFPTWREPHKILQMANLIVVRRAPRVGGNQTLHLDVETALRTLDLDWKREGDTLTILHSARPVTLLDVDLSKAESSVIRDKLANQETIPDDWLPTRVFNYINAHHLYQPGEYP